MPRVKRSVPARRRHKKILNLAKGFRMTHRTLFRPANEAVMHALEYAYRDRRGRQRHMRQAWAARTNAAPCRPGVPLNHFLHPPHAAGGHIKPKNLRRPADRGAPTLS